MTRRTGLGRHGRIEDAAGDPLDGLVNLFDIGIVLAIAFLIAGLSLTLDQHTRRLQARTPTTQGQQTQTLPAPPSPSVPAASGRGQPVGTVYRLSDGRLVYVQTHGPRESG
jgi:hypothetical protein